jgi:hypothetical protein
MSEQKRDREQAIADRARELFGESVRSVDGETRSKLAQARAKAVEAAVSARGFSWLSAPSALVPLGGVAAAALAVALIWQDPVVPPASMQTTVLNDLELLTEGENLDLLEDLEFYAWLLEQDDMVSGADRVSGADGVEGGDAQDGSG